MRFSPLVLLLAVAPATAAPVNTWTKSDAVIAGKRWDVPLGYDPAAAVHRPRSHSVDPR